MNRLQRQFTGDDRRRVVVKATTAKLTLITCSGTLSMGMQGRSEETVKRIFDSEIPERMVRSDWSGAERMLRDIESKQCLKAAAGGQSNAIL
ncbi:MAG: hypothetical protein WCI51_01050 [Lentisphaerota bacterium]